MRLRQITSALLMGVVALLPSLALAEGEQHGPALWTLWANFLIYIFIIYLLARKPVAAGWNTRRAKIKEAVERSAREESQARAAVEIIESKLRNSPKEIDEIKRSIEGASFQESELMIKDAEKRAAQILKEGKELAVAEQRAAFGSLRREIADEVIAKARTLIRSRMKGEVDRGLRAKALEGLKQLVQAH